MPKEIYGIPYDHFKTRDAILVLLLNEGCKHVTEIASDIGRHYTIVSQHLCRLQKQELVSLERSGNKKFYELTEAGSKKIKPLAEWLKTF